MGNSRKQDIGSLKATFIPNKASANTTLQVPDGSAVVCNAEDRPYPATVRQAAFEQQSAIAARSGIRLNKKYENW